jgi:hypothetical protein
MHIIVQEWRMYDRFLELVEMFKCTEQFGPVPWPPQVAYQLYRELLLLQKMCTCIRAEIVLRRRFIEIEKNVNLPWSVLVQIKSYL